MISATGTGWHRFRYMACFDVGEGAGIFPLDQPTRHTAGVSTALGSQCYVTLGSRSPPSVASGAEVLKELSGANAGISALVPRPKIGVKYYPAGPDRPASLYIDSDLTPSPQIFSAKFFGEILDLGSSP